MTLRFFVGGHYDDIFGVTADANWQRWFVNAQFQYYLRTEGRSGFKYGDEIIVSGRPGFFSVVGIAVSGLPHR